MPINRRQQVFPNGTLIVENVQRSLDQGTYTCVAKTLGKSLGRRPCSSLYITTMLHMHRTHGHGQESDC